MALRRAPPHEATLIDPGLRPSLADRALFIHRRARVPADGRIDAATVETRRCLAAATDLRAQALELRGAPADLLVDCGRVERVVRDFDGADDTFAALLVEELGAVAGRVVARLAALDRTAPEDRALAS